MNYDNLYDKYIFFLFNINPSTHQKFIDVLKQLVTSSNVDTSSSSSAAATATAALSLSSSGAQATANTVSTDNNNKLTYLLANGKIMELFWYRISQSLLGK